MKASILFLPLLYCLILPSITNSQAPCPGSFKEYYLNSNKINAAFFPGGNKFLNGERAGFRVPYPEGKGVATIYASAPWIGGFDDAGNIKLAAETYPSTMANDFYSGPLNSIGIPYDIPCSDFDRIWSVFGDDIRHHIEDAADGIIDDTIASIFGWPARGNSFFEIYNGFELPQESGTWASFRDLNANGRFDPDEGEYPEVQYNNNYYIPDQTLWTVFHDVGTHSSGGDPLRFEIQLTAFVFNCQENVALNNTIFNSYKIINRSVLAVDSTFFGMWTDYDLGCPSDDLVGSDSLRNSEFVYNESNYDGFDSLYYCQDIKTFEDKIPVQSMTYLSHPMNSFIAVNGSQFLPPERYNLLNGIWPDGSPIVPEGNGDVPGSTLQPTKFLYNGDPRDTSSWSAINAIEGGYDTRTLSSVYLGRMVPGQIETVVSAYMFHYDSLTDNLGQIGLMQMNIDTLLNTLYNLNEACTPFPACYGPDCVWPGDYNRNGIANHEDLLWWGLMKDYSGVERNGLISWNGHFADEWVNNTPQGINFKHGDGDGNGTINNDDLYPLHVNYKLTTPYYEPKALYPKGPEIVISSDSNFHSSGGRIRNLKIEVGTDIENVFGLAFEIDFDTSLYRVHLFEEITCPEQSPIECFFDGPFQNFENPSPNLRYAFVKTDHYGFDLKAGLDLYSNPPGLRLKEGFVFNDLPDTVRVRLKNLIAIDSAGNDLHIGANELIFLKNMSVGTADPDQSIFSVYPNPASDFIHFNMEKEMTFHVYTIQGQLRDAFTASPVGQVDISGYNAGIYFLKSVETGWVTKLLVH